MASIYARGGRLWCRVKNEAGKWISRPTPFVAGDERKAERYAEAAQKAIAGRRDAGADAGPPTVAAYAERWIAARRRRGVASVADDAARLRLHVLPVLGAMRMDAVRPRHVRDLVLEMRTAGKLAPRTMRQVIGLLHTMFKSAVIEEVVPSNPIVLERGTLPKKADKDPTWRADAIYTRDEVEMLISDERILADRRVLYGLKGLAALRHGEAAALRWSQYDAAAQPLGAIHLGKTKSGVPRSIPVHPALAKLLAAWKLGGWEATYGRRPRAEDLIVPTRNETVRQPSEAQAALLGDLAMLGLRTRAGARQNRRGHDLRRTFITLAQVDGADRFKLEAVTHGPRGEIIDQYTSFPWPTLCAEVAKLNVAIRKGDVLAFATPFATAPRAAGNRWRKEATPTGFEGVSTTASVREGLPDTRVDSNPADPREPSRASTVASLATALATAVLDGDAELARALAEELRRVAHGAMGGPAGSRSAAGG